MTSPLNVIVVVQIASGLVCLLAGCVVIIAFDAAQIHRCRSSPVPTISIPVGLVTVDDK
jgi:hypothetical protein